MQTFRNILGWLGNFSIIIPSLIVIFAQWAPSSILPYVAFIPSDRLFTCAIYGAITLAILVPLSLLKKYNNEEGGFTFFSGIKYVFLFILSVLFGAFMGYVGTIKAGYILGNTLMKETLTDKTPLSLSVEEKKYNEVRSRFAYCKYELNLNMTSEDTPFYEKFVTPNPLCVRDTLYNEVSSGENIILLGDGSSILGFFLREVVTQKSIEKIKKAMQEKEINEKEITTPEQEENKEKEENK